MKRVGREEVQAYGVWSRHTPVTDYGDDYGAGTATTKGDKAADFRMAWKPDGPSDPSYPRTKRCDWMAERE